MENHNISRELDFSKLVEKYPELRPWFHHNRFEWHDNSAVVLITRILLQEWGLQVQIDSNRLCPRLFNRLDYLDFMHDLLGSFKNTVGLDVGTGHLAIYALLGAKLYGLEFVASDIDRESLRLAESNISRNGLGSAVTLVHNEPSESFFDCLVSRLGPKHGFVMCNPPFYSSATEMRQRADLKADARAVSAMANELVVEGGEIAFVSRMIRESESHKESNITWFTSLLGKYDSLKPLVSLLRSKKIDNFGVHAFRSSLTQTGTQRWILFWSFKPDRPKADLFNSIVTQKVRREFKCNQKNLKERLHALDSIDVSEPNQSSLVLQVPGNVWSRSYRRQKRYAEDQMRVKITFDENTVVTWKSGLNYQLFESFCNWCKEST
ncbi:hypothetical protein OGAPHI_004604 [Ogataea philodendri]|uniref:U6 small nuclear RNA (adenine-(43)-N(6))-methyltransferase n=1 Tax=Ogataea philodendri TaxID=1378263 RepID=A0A9P8P2Y0_9ASCO|nr:uncharacterized protein OGAPHI_004604 [Ogataea philodendri]KAH3664252.1 hypothetical protein OGAPHI_004604 [Ogataea philodendri]